MILSRTLGEWFATVLSALCLAVCTVCVWMIVRLPILAPMFMLAHLFSFLLPLYTTGKKLKIRIRMCNYGVKLLVIFCATTPFAIIANLIIFLNNPIEVWWHIILSGTLAFLIEACAFWVGITLVYSNSVQLGIKLRVLGAIFGLVPIVNLVFLFKIILTVSRECKTETQKTELNAARKDKQICATKYPVLLVHGVFFRDIKLLNYWGRIPAELKANGASVYYGNHQSASSVKDSAEELARRIEEIVNTTGCEKLNIIAHSKGGLDCRYLIKHTEAGKYIASLTTINTPHRGCLFADYLLKIAPESFKLKAADAYNSAMQKLGDTSPDFLAAVQNLTEEYCKEFDEATPPPQNIYCQSVGSKLTRASHGKFPLNLTYRLAKLFDGPNDGLVGESSFRFGENYILLTPNGRRGISHGDMIDLNRENIKDFDVREFYVGLVNDLKTRGL